MKNQYRERNEEVLEVMASFHGTSIEDEWTRVSRWMYDYDTATYQLLLEKHRLELPLTMNTNFCNRFRQKVSLEFMKHYILCKISMKKIKWSTMSN